MLFVVLGKRKASQKKESGTLKIEDPFGRLIKFSQDS